MGLFKRFIDPVTFAELTNANCKFVNTICGNDLSGNGTRENPYATIAKTISLGNTKILLNGLSIETTDLPYIIGDNQESGIIGNVNRGAFGTGQLTTKITVIGDLVGVYNYKLKNVYIRNTNMTSAPDIFESSDFFINMFAFARYAFGITRMTCLDYVNYSRNDVGICKIYNSIFIRSIDLYNYTSLTLGLPLFYYCLFRKATIWKWNGATINTSSVTDVDSLIAVMTAYGVAMGAVAAKTYFQAMFPAAGGTNILFNCRVVDDSANPIFNRYDINGNVIDYTLKLDSNNIALTMSDTMSYVGCYQASAKTNSDPAVLEFGTPAVVDGNGATTTGTAELLVYSGDGKFQIGVAESAQTRNRCTSSNVVKFERGFTLVGFQSQMKSALGSRFSFGKNQLYNNIIAPCLPMESLEVIPYDTIDHASSEVGYSQFPRFSAMFNDRCQMWYKTSTNQPLLFSDLNGLGITITQEPSLTSAFLTEYGAWAVTNADMVSYLLSSITGCALRNIPVYFAKIELNLNYYN